MAGRKQEIYSKLKQAAVSAAPATTRTAEAIIFMQTCPNRSRCLPHVPNPRLRVSVGAEAAVGMFIRIHPKIRQQHMKGKLDWRKWRRLAAGKLRGPERKLRGWKQKLRGLKQRLAGLKQKPQIFAAAAAVAGGLLLAFGLLSDGGKPVRRTAAAPRVSAPGAASQAAAASDASAAKVLVELVVPEVSDDGGVDDPLTAAEANPEPEYAPPPAAAQNMHAVCENYFRQAAACYRRAPDGQAEALLQSLEATRGDLSQLDGEGCEVVARQFDEMAQQMGCGQKTVDDAPPPTGPADAKAQAASSARGSQTRASPRPAP